MLSLHRCDRIPSEQFPCVMRGSTSMKWDLETINFNTIVVERGESSAPSKNVRTKTEREYCVGVVKRTIKVRAFS